MKYFLIFLLLISTPVFAQDLPAHFVVKDVAASDRLNIRAEPNGRSEILGDYYAYAVNIEVIKTTPDGRWGMVGAGERNGWVSMRFLERSNDQTVNEFPRPISCFGTEPFWNLNVTVRGDEYTELGMDRRDLTMVSSVGGQNGGIATFQEGPTLNRTLTIQKGYCDDGMSDREFGWTSTLFTEAPDGNYTQSGCCTLEAN